MKKIITTALLLISLVSLVKTSNGQCCPFINSIRVEPGIPNNNDQISIITQVTTSSTGFRLSKSFLIRNDTIFIEGCYSAGPLTQPEIFIDTFNIGMLTLGMHTIVFTAYQTGSPIFCNKLVFQTMISAIQVNMVGVNSTVSIDGIAIYPNPFMNTVSVNGNELKQATILNINGQVLLNKELSSSCNAINTESLSPGIYILDITKVDGSVFRTKVVKVQ